MFSLLYTVYSIPNVILPFFGGYFIDKWGARLTLLIFAALITAGQAIFAFGLSIKSWPVMLIGRVVYGFGGESLGVGNSAILSVWFKGKELAFAFGLNLSIARLGSVINNVVSPAIASGIDIQFALWFGVILCGASVVSVLGISAIDKRFELLLGDGKGLHGLLKVEEEPEPEEVEVDLKKNADEDEEGEYGDSRRSAVEDSLFHATNRAVSVGSVGEQLATKKTPEISFKDMFKFRQVFWILTVICCVVYGCVLPFNNVASTLLLERDYFKEPPSGCALTDPTQCEYDVGEPDYNAPNDDCPSSKWYQPPLPTNPTIDGKTYNDFSASDIDCTEGEWSDSDSCTYIYCKRQTDAEAQAGTIMSIPYIISACLSPILGGFVDRFGMRAIIATIAPLVLVIVHLFLGFTSVSPVGPLVGQGLAYSGFAAVLWPSIAMVVDEHLVGLAYGIVVSVQNMGLASFPLIIAAIYQSNGDQYIPAVEVFFVVCAWLGVVIGLYLNWYDYHYLKSLLNAPKRQPSTRESMSSRPSISNRASGSMSRQNTGTGNPLQNPVGDEKVKVFGNVN